MRWLTLALLVACAAALLVGLAAYPILDGDEGLFAETAREMALTGDWLVPRFCQVERLNKPPLFYWVAAAAMRLAGPSEWAARIGPAPAG